MRLVIDTTGMTFTVGSDFEPVLDFETKQPKADRQTGAMLAQVQVIAFYTDDRGKPRSEIITVKLPDPTPGAQGNRKHRAERHVLQFDGERLGTCKQALGVIVHL